MINMRMRGIFIEKEQMEKEHVTREELKQKLGNEMQKKHEHACKKKDKDPEPLLLLFQCWDEKEYKTLDGRSVKDIIEKGMILEDER